MRPLKQVGVVTTHCLLFFAPATAGVTAGAVLDVSHVTRFAFLFLSAAMLVYAYPTLQRRDLGRFWRRRLLAVGLPYLGWTVVYFAVEAAHLEGLPGAFDPSGALGVSLPADLHRFGTLLLEGYYQLYYLVVLLEFCVVFPAFLWLLRRSRRRPRRLLAISVATQLLLTSLVHWAVLPGWMRGFYATRELWNYQLFLVAGGLLGMHYRAVDAWLRRRWRFVAGATLASLALAEAWYYLAALGVVPALAGESASDPFQPVLVPLFGGVTLCLYLAGSALTGGRRPARVRAWVASAAVNAYGVYLSQVLFIIALTLLGWGSLEAVLPWPLVVAGAVVVTYAGGLLLTSLLARLPGARMTAGRPRVTWRAAALGGPGRGAGPDPGPPPGPARGRELVGGPVAG